jgi:drug/metabolite transporter (DMT)-like permease
MNVSSRACTVLKVLIIACIGSTAIHYTDNAISIDKYPPSDTVNAQVVVLTWLLVTPAAFLGYRLYANGRRLLAYGALAVYSFVGLSTPGHYTSGSFGDFAWWRNVSIISDGVAGATIVAFVLWSALIAREWAQPGVPLAQPSPGRIG